MSRLLRALEKVGLVETDKRAEEAPRLDAADDIPPPPAEPVPMAVSAPAPVVASGPILEQRPLEDIYSSAQIGSSPFPAEKLLKILEGLAALEPAARRAAVTALDAADDAWTIDDALLDAERKIKALDGACKQVEEQARAALEEARAAVEAREHEQTEAVARIRRQIGELEGLLEREVARATEEKAALHDGARAAKDACTRECTRLDAEAHRLRRLAEVFTAGAPSGPARA